MSISTVTTLNVPLQETLAFVSYHLRSGVDHMFLFFDDPEDKAISFLDGKDQVTCVRCEEEHWARLGVEADASIQEKQISNATCALQHARKRGIDWIAHIDSDELLYSGKSLHALFSAVSPDVDVVLFPVMEAVPQKLRYRHPFQEISLFKHYINLDVDDVSFTMKPFDHGRYRIRSQVWRRKKQLATLLDCRHTNVIGSYVLGHKVGKSATRTTAHVERMGNHLPFPAETKRLCLSVAPDGAVLHFDCRGYEQWKAKWENRVHGNANFDTSRFAPHRRTQVRLFRAAYEQGDKKALVDLYKKWYFMSSYERSLMRGLGLVKQIDLPPSLFAMS